MSDKLQGGILAGSTSVSLPVILRKTADNTENTGTLAASVTAYYWRQGGTPTALTAASDLAAITSAWAAGGWKAPDATNEPGVYRLDVDNAAFAAGADWVVISVKVASCYLFVEKYPLTSNVIQSANNPTAAQIAAGVWQDTTAGHFNVANSIGLSLYTGVAAGASNGLAIVSDLASDYQQRGQPVTLSAADSLTMSSGTATAGTANTITLQTALGHDGFGVGSRIKITGGTGALQCSTITGYVNSTQVATVFPAWTVTPDATSVYAIAWDIDPKTTVWSQVMIELAAVPSVTDTILHAMEWLFILGRNKITETASTQLVRNNADSATIGTTNVSDDGTTFIRGPYS